MDGRIVKYRWRVNTVDWCTCVTGEDKSNERNGDGYEGYEW